MVKDTKTLNWDGWNSPIGLGVFIVSVALALALVAQSISLFADVGLKQIRIVHTKDFIKEGSPPNARGQNAIEINTAPANGAARQQPARGR
ncbi:hypothetical protein RDn1_146 [Candidatus Termititenax dinenymphae]|uniref:Uncharacterized protein n=1 Tax=Candidatus Termititenax dinenymphae TaxID=2218523 RepID=A0A388TJJ3_9BACT|nr:hypothetical protein RDn1_146 [Candidatus Termititenax dinenymphae]